MKFKVRDVTGGQKDTLAVLFLRGPVYDGYVPSKQARDEVVTMGLAQRLQGFTFLIREGVALCTCDETMREVKGWSSRLWYQKLNASM